jgi:multidrug resistance efflux pump
LSRRRIFLYVGLSIVPLIAALWIAGVDPNYLLGNDVTANSAYVTGEVMQASAPVSGTVTRILYKTGDPVQTGQTIAYLSAPAQADQEIAVVPPVKAPGPGTIIHMGVIVGENVTVGQQIAAIADLQRLYVVAAVDENSFAPVRSGELADIYLPALNEDFSGTVSQLSPDLGETRPRTSSGGFSTQAPSGTGASTTGEIPVRIDFSYGDALVYPGMTATVTIYVTK